MYPGLIHLFRNGEGRRKGEKEEMTSAVATQIGKNFMKRTDLMNAGTVKRLGPFGVTINKIVEPLIPRLGSKCGKSEKSTG